MYDVNKLLKKNKEAKRRNNNSNGIIVSCMSLKIISVHIKKEKIVVEKIQRDEELMDLLPLDTFSILVPPWR